jgi:hypothetical protein
MYGEEIDKSRAYVFESDPLKIAIDPEVGDLIYTSVGDCFKCVRDAGGSFLFEMVHPTVLSDGSLLPDLTENQLKLFWALSRTELKKAGHGVKDTY